MITIKEVAFILLFGVAVFALCYPFWHYGFKPWAEDLERRKAAFRIRKATFDAKQKDGARTHVQSSMDI